LTSGGEFNQQLPFPPFSPFDAQHRRSNYYPQDSVLSAMPAITYASPDYRPPPPTNYTSSQSQLETKLQIQQQQPSMVQDTDIGDSSGSDEEFGNLPTPAEYTNGDSLERGWSQILYGQDQDTW
jgi:hypothetical protein